MAIRRRTCSALAAAGHRARGRRARPARTVHLGQGAAAARLAEITPVSSPYSAFNNLPTPERLDKLPQPMSSGEEGAGGGGGGVPAVGSGMDYDATPDAATQGTRALAALAVTGNVVDSMKPLPGRKSVALISGGLPVFDSGRQQADFNGAPRSKSPGQKLAARYRLPNLPGLRLKPDAALACSALLAEHAGHRTLATSGEGAFGIPNSTPAPTP